MKLSFKQKMARLAMIPAALSAGIANAAIDTATTTVLTDAKADVLTLGALVFAIVVAIMIYKWFRRAL
ncbi:MAG: hypothetical protein HC858_05890 [Brachymonas sp.]|nr:hypothetical protein [Brachymonas sp.]